MTVITGGCKIVYNDQKARPKEGPFLSHALAAANANVVLGSWYFLAVVNNEWTYSAGSAGPFYNIGATL